MKHSDLVNEILLYMSPLGVAWSNATGAVKTEDRFLRYGLKGSSDILACIGGRFVGVEVKVGRDRQRDAQCRFGAVKRGQGMAVADFADLLADGMSVRATSEAMGVSIDTGKSYLRRIRHKLGWQAQ